MQLIQLSKSVGVVSLAAIFFILFFYTQAIAKDIYLGSNQPRPAGWSENARQKIPRHFFDYDWAKIVWDSWPKAKLRQKLIEDCGYDVNIREVWKRIKGKISLRYANKTLQPVNFNSDNNNGFARWHQANRTGWQKYKNLANQLPDDPDELLKAIAKIDKLTVEQRKGLKWHFDKWLPAANILQYKPEDMDLEYFKQCHDSFLLFDYWKAMVDNIFGFDDHGVVTNYVASAKGYNLFYDSVYNIPDWFSEPVAIQLRKAANWKYMRKD